MTDPAKTVTVGGLDPGPKPGSCVLTLEALDLTHALESPPVHEVVSCTTGEMDSLLECDYIAIERYVLQPRAGRSQDKRAQVTTLAMAEDMAQRALVAKGSFSRVQYLGPGNVKPWATNRRLERYGVLVKGDHHRDAVRHALYFAVKLGLLPRR